jgi:hypothetical protein
VTGDEQPGYADAAAVAGLAREVEALRRSVEPLKGLSGQVEDLARVVTELAERVASHTRKTNGSKVAALSWLDLPEDMQTAHQVLAELVGWLPEVYLRYADAARSFPDCWLWHPDVVEELLWLMATWQAAYRGEGATVAAAGDWHDRYRPGVVRRIKATAGTCSPENHLPRADRPSGARPVVPLADALGEIAGWWAQHRADQPPHPTQHHLDQTTAQRRR